MTAELRINYLHDEDDVGQLVATVRSGGYGGTGSAYFSREMVESFINDLRACPLPADRLPKIEGGRWSKERDKLEECRFRLAIRPFNLRGQLMVLVDLATELPVHTIRDHQQSVSARFRTDYAELDVFASELLEVLDGTRDEAVLPGTAF